MASSNTMTTKKTTQWHFYAMATQQQQQFTAEPALVIVDMLPAWNGSSTPLLSVVPIQDDQDEENIYGSGDDNNGFEEHDGLALVLPASNDDLEGLVPVGSVRAVIPAGPGGGSPTKVRFSIDTQHSAGGLLFTINETSGQLSFNASSSRNSSVVALLAHLRRQGNITLRVRVRVVESGTVQQQKVHADLPIRVFLVNPGTGAVELANNHGTANDNEKGGLHFRPRKYTVSVREATPTTSTLAVIWPENAPLGARLRFRLWPAHPAFWLHPRTGVLRLLPAEHGGRALDREEQARLQLVVECLGETTKEEDGLRKRERRLSGFVLVTVRTSFSCLCFE
jgi:hypothetical protein